jgi:DHA1 family tetracycline resistance protein-like MFS transporter
MTTELNPNTVRFVLLTIVIDAMGFGIIMPVGPRLLMEVGHLDLAGAAYMNTFLTLLFASMQFLFGTVIGNLGDRFGRRPVLLTALGGLAINFLLQAQAHSLVWLFAGQAISGICGGTYGAAQAALADISTPDNRARVFGYVGAAFGIGFVIGPSIGGLLGGFGPRVPFYAASLLAALNFLYGVTVFPETLARANRRAFDWRRANPVGALLKLRAFPGLTMLSVVLLFWQIASLVYPLTWSYYLIGAFHASSQLIGISLACVGISIAAVQMLVTGKLVARLGERNTVFLGLSMATWTFLLLAVAPLNPWLMLLGFTMPLGNITQPALMAMMSRRATANNQGEVQGFSASVMSLGTIIAPLVHNPVFAYFMGPRAPFKFAGAAFILAAAIALVTIMLLMLTPRAKTSQPVLAAAFD